ncbi:MAG: hypothetical protein KBS81_08505 [Spirochaetales bacterium]|nr:hypothetical protein [Candidatus Physcosoma equi]
MDEQKPKKAWQKKKEGWYEHVHLSVRQLDVIIGIGIAALLVVGDLIGLEAAGIFTLFS